jgi:hypothetical protein
LSTTSEAPPEAFKIGEDCGLGDVACFQFSLDLSDRLAINRLRWAAMRLARWIGSIASESFAPSRLLLISSFAKYLFAGNHSARATPSRSTGVVVKGDF